MELDLSEYDQVDEIRLIRESQNQLCNAASLAPKFIATLSSCSDPTNFDEANCENDFVFLPDLAEQTGGQVQQTSGKQEELASQSDQSTASNRQQPVHEANTTSHQQVSSKSTRALMSIQTENIASNPFWNSQQQHHHHHHQQQQQQELQQQRSNVNDEEQSCEEQQGLLKSESCASKPSGLLEVCPNIASNPHKLADLLRQIVTKSDLIYIAIPCAYCHEQIACLPSDISGWLNHMSCQHNCKLCPICNKMIGLGPRKLIDIMKRHVLEHLDNDWLERRAMKVNFSFGLQQQWFSGNRCSVRDTPFS